MENSYTKVHLNNESLLQGDDLDDYSMVPGTLCGLPMMVLSGKVDEAQVVRTFGSAWTH